MRVQAGCSRASDAPEIRHPATPPSEACDTDQGSLCDPAAAPVSPREGAQITELKATMLLTAPDNLYPDLLEEFTRVPANRRFGPMIVSEGTGAPWRAWSFRHRWRQIARAAGIPDDIQARDARAGAITEMRDAGVPIEDAMRHATRATEKIHEIYIRGSSLERDEFTSAHSRPL